MNYLNPMLLCDFYKIAHKNMYPKGTEKYDKNRNFNRKLFLEWVESLNEPVFISEYQLELKSFIEIWNKKTTSKKHPNKQKQSIEKVFANKQAIELIEKQPKIFSLS